MSKEFQKAHLDFLKNWGHLIKNSGKYPVIEEYFKFFERRNKVLLHEYYNYRAYSIDILKQVEQYVACAAYFNAPNSPVKNLYLLLQFSETQHIQCMLGYDHKKDRFVMSCVIVCDDPQFVVGFTEKHSIFEVEIEEQKTVGFGSPASK